MRVHVSSGENRNTYDPVVSVGLDPESDTLTLYMGGFEIDIKADHWTEVKIERQPSPSPPSNSGNRVRRIILDDD